MQRPFRTINEGYQFLLSHGDRIMVLVATGDYRENLTIGGITGIFGGYDSTQGWKRTRTARTKIIGPTTPAVLIDGVQGAVRLGGVTIVAADAQTPGQSAAALIVRNTQEVILDNAVIVAPRGRTGADGQPGAVGGSGVDGGAGGNQACIDGTCFEVYPCSDDMDCPFGAVCGNNWYCVAF